MIVQLVRSLSSFDVVDKVREFDKNKVMPQGDAVVVYEFITNPDN